MIEDVHNFGPYYDRTLMAWHRNVTAAWDDLPAYDGRFRRTWDYYLLRLGRIIPGPGPAALADRVSPAAAAAPTSTTRPEAGLQEPEV